MCLPPFLLARASPYVFVMGSGGQPAAVWAIVALGLLWLGLFVHQLRGRALLPLHDPEFTEAVGHVRTA